MRPARSVLPLFLVMAAIGAAPCLGQTPVVYSCRQPTTGSPAVSFRWHISSPGSNDCVFAASTPGTVVTLMLSTAGERVWVEGVDARSRIGARSLASEPWSPALPTGASGAESARPLECYPNPFNPRTTIRFELPRSQQVRLAVYGLGGRLVSVLASGVFAAGRHEVVWGGRDARGLVVASGLYVSRLESGGSAQTVRMMLVR